MGRRKIEIEPLTDDRNRTVTFVKRKAGLFKKAYELAILCQVDLSVVIVGNNNKIYEFSTVDTNEVIKTYQLVSKSKKKIHESKSPEAYLDYKKKIKITDSLTYKNGEVVSTAIAAAAATAAGTKKSSSSSLANFTSTATNAKEFRSGDEMIDDDYEDDEYDDDDDDDDDDNNNNCKDNSFDQSIKTDNLSKRNLKRKHSPNDIGIQDQNQNRNRNPKVFNSKRPAPSPPPKHISLSNVPTFNKLSKPKTEPSTQSQTYLQLHQRSQSTPSPIPPKREGGITRPVLRVQIPTDAKGTNTHTHNPAMLFDGEIKSSSGRDTARTITAIENTNSSIQQSSSNQSGSQGIGSSGSHNHNNNHNHNLSQQQSVDSGPYPSTHLMPGVPSTKFSGYSSFRSPDTRKPMLPLPIQSNSQTSSPASATAPGLPNTSSSSGGNSGGGVIQVGITAPAASAAFPPGNGSLHHNVPFANNTFQNNNANNATIFYTMQQQQQQQPHQQQQQLQALQSPQYMMYSSVQGFNTPLQFQQFPGALNLAQQAATHQKQQTTPQRIRQTNLIQGQQLQQGQLQTPSQTPSQTQAQTQTQPQNPLADTAARFRNGAQTASTFASQQSQNTGEQTPLSGLPSRYVNDMFPFPSPSNFLAPQDWPTGITPTTTTSNMQQFFSNMMPLQSAGGINPLQPQPPQTTASTQTTQANTTLNSTGQENVQRGGLLDASGTPSYRTHISPIIYSGSGASGNLRQTSLVGKISEEEDEEGDEIRDEVGTNPSTAVQSDTKETGNGDQNDGK